jgi:ribosomal protein L17
LAIKDDLRNYEIPEGEESSEDEDYTESSDDEEKKKIEAEQAKRMDNIQKMVEGLMKAEEEKKKKEEKKDQELDDLRKKIDSLIKQNELRSKDKEMERMRKLIEKLSDRVAKLQSTVEDQQKQLEQKDEVIEKLWDEIDKLFNKAQGDFTHFTAATTYNSRNIRDISHILRAYWYAGENIFDRLAYVEDHTNQRMPGRRFTTRDFPPPVLYQMFKTTYKGNEAFSKSSEKKKGASRRHPVIIEEDDGEQARQPSEAEVEVEAESSEAHHGPGYMEEIFGRNPREYKVLKPDSKIYQLPEKPWNEEDKE